MLFDTRERALTALQSGLLQYAIRTEDLFLLLDSLLDECTRAKKRSADDRVTVAGLILAKGRNLSLALYSLCLDGLAQEAGALLRPLIECIERLEYVRRNTQHAEILLTGKKPAGDIAKEIGSPHRRLREHLNVAASHASFDYHAVVHLVAPANGGVEFRKEQPYVESKLRRNLLTLHAVQVLLCIAGWNCIATLPGVDASLADRIDALRDAVTSEMDG